MINESNIDKILRGKTSEKSKSRSESLELQDKEPASKFKPKLNTSEQRTPQPVTESAQLIIFPNEQYKRQSEGPYRTSSIFKR